MPFRRVATCCYCGTSAELPKHPAPGRIGCISCGAPLRRLGVATPDPAPIPRGTARHDGPTIAPLMPSGRRGASDPRGSPVKPARTKRRKPFAARLWDRLDNLIEDVVDDIFD
jgi:hypothetical protein